MATESRMYSTRRGRLIAIATGVLVATLAVFSISQAEPKAMSKMTVADVRPDVWQKLASKRIYFGHQSVGDNILLGVRDVLAEHPDIHLNVHQKPELIQLTQPVFVHSYIGNNEDPLSKINGFAEIVRDKLHGKVDVAFFKYCFADVDHTSDVGAMFEQYKKTMAELKRQYPGVTFVHVTIPLMTVQTGPWAWFKGVIGRRIGGYDDNIKRNQYNDLLRREYSSHQPLFDLAKVEATRPDGSMMTFHSDGKEYTALVPEYSRDGGHLNESGRKYVAEQFLMFLAQAVSGEKI